METPGHHITLPPPHGPTRPRQDSICYLSKKKKKRNPLPYMPQVDDSLLLFGKFYTRVHSAERGRAGPGKV